MTEQKYLLRCTTLGCLYVKTGTLDELTPLAQEHAVAENHMLKFLLLLRRDE